MVHGRLKLSGRSHVYLSSQDGMHLGAPEGHRHAAMYLDPTLH